MPDRTFLSVNTGPSAFLLFNESASLFAPDDHQTSSNFMRDARLISATNAVGYGTKIIFEINKFADLLGETWIRFRLPALATPYDATADPLAAGGGPHWVDYVGHRLIERVEVLDGSERILDISGDHLHDHQLLRLDDERTVTNDENVGSWGSMVERQRRAMTPQELFVSLSLAHWVKAPSQYLPFDDVARNIRIHVTLRAAAEVVNFPDHIEGGDGVATPIPGAPLSIECDLLLMGYHITQRERNALTAAVESEDGLMYPFIEPTTQVQSVTVAAPTVTEQVIDVKLPNFRFSSAFTSFTVVANDDIVGRDNFATVVGAGLPGQLKDPYFYRDVETAQLFSDGKELTREMTHKEMQYAQMPLFHGGQGSTGIYVIMQSDLLPEEEVDSAGSFDYASLNNVVLRIKLRKVSNLGNAPPTTGSYHDTTDVVFDNEFALTGVEPDTIVPAFYHDRDNASRVTNYVAAQGLEIRATSWDKKFNQLQGGQLRQVFT